MPTVLQEGDVPDAVRLLTPMERVDYVDVFTARVAAAAERSPEEWARAAMEGAAGRRGQFVWRNVLRLRLQPLGTSGHIAGWRIAGRGVGGLRLEAASPILTAHLVVSVDDGQMSVGTFIRYDRPVAALIWPPLSVVHRRAMPGLLRAAVRRLGLRDRR